MRMFAPSLYVLRDGTLVCLHGSYGPGGLRVIFSTDGGETWIAPAKGHGFRVDNSYGYGKPMEFPDGSLFIAYIATGGHRTEDARTNGSAPSACGKCGSSGIDLLPALQPGCEVTLTGGTNPRRLPLSECGWETDHLRYMRNRLETRNGGPYRGHVPIPCTSAVNAVRVASAA